MTLDELGSKLKELDRTRELARAELGRLLKRRERVEDLEQDRDAVIESYAGMLPEALEALSGEERRRLYGMLRLEVAPTPEGLEVSGALSTSGPRSTPESRSTKRSELRFRASLTEGSQEVCFDAR